MTTATTIQRNTFYGDQGNPYRVIVTTTTGGTLSEDYWTEQEAWDAKDRLHNAGFAVVRVVGAPTRGYAVAPLADETARWLNTITD